MERFLDRRDGGRQLAQKLSKFADRPDVTILALPRGGVPVAYEVALALQSPQDFSQTTDEEVRSLLDEPIPAAAGISWNRGALFRL
jgi:predicted phosphoribosyltransferase